MSLEGGGCVWATGGRAPLPRPSKSESPVTKAQVAPRRLSSFALVSVPPPPGSRLLERCRGLRGRDTVLGTRAQQQPATKTASGLARSGAGRLRAGPAAGTLLLPPPTSQKDTGRAAPSRGKLGEAARRRPRGTPGASRLPCVARVGRGLGLRGRRSPSGGRFPVTARPRPARPRALGPCLCPRSYLAMGCQGGCGC